jgi:hypothetical protein
MTTNSPSLFRDVSCLCVSRIISSHTYCQSAQHTQLILYPIEHAQAGANMLTTCWDMTRSVLKYYLRMTLPAFLSRAKYALQTFFRRSQMGGGGVVNSAISIGYVKRFFCHSNLSRFFFF